MLPSLVGKKAGMTRVFLDTGVAIPVTVIAVEPNTVTQIKTKAKEGYSSVQVTTGHRRPSRVNKALGGHYVKANVQAGLGLWEFRLPGEKLKDISLAQQFNADMFKAGQAVDVTAKTQGKGFAGTVKRHNFSMQDATHGNSLSHRAPGSIGQCQDPGRVFKGKKMAGQMGNVRRTAQNLEIVRVDTERNLLLVKGAIPGPKGQLVVVKYSIKRKKSVQSEGA